MDEENADDPHANSAGSDDDINPPNVNIDSLANIQDNVVAKATLCIYINDNVPFLK